MRILLTQKKKKIKLESLIFLGLFAFSSAYIILFYNTQMAWIGLLAVVASLGGFFRSLWGAPMLLLKIDDTGIYDRRIGVLIRWADIRAVELQTLAEKNYLRVKTHDPEKFLSRMPIKKRRRFEHQQGLGFEGFNVDITALDVPAIEIKRVVDKRITARN